MKKLLVASLTMASIGLSARLPAELEPSCRMEIKKLCGMTRDRSVIRKCLRENYQSLSKPCLQSLLEMRRNSEPQAIKASGGKSYSYGSAERQAFDFYPTPSGGRPTLVVFIHGGGWSIGDKTMSTGSKASHFNEKGFAFASINYRLVPETNPAGQATDVAAALAALRARAGKLGFDPDSIILMGHSAGAHLAALVSTDPRYFETADVPMVAIRGAILLDGAGYDVPRQMERAGPMLGKMYRDAFTTDKETQIRLSPLAHAATPNVSNWLILFDKARADSGSQSNALAEALTRAGSLVSAVPISDTTHMKLNREMGVDGDPATRLVDAFIERIL
ncbi:MAG: alpha/beta hydrolase [Sphingomonadaceae bacterium]|nr:alpha/beta hydrolase [Sphingomonadaceae bacterium]